jgi:hypothetical protein
LTGEPKFLYNSGLFRIHARGRRNRESLHGASMRQTKQEIAAKEQQKSSKKKGRSIFLDRS